MAKNCSKDTKISFEFLHRFLYMTGFPSVTEGKTEGTASFLNYKRKKNS